MAKSSKPVNMLGYLKRGILVADEIKAANPLNLVLIGRVYWIIWGRGQCNHSVLKSGRRNPKKKLKSQQSEKDHIWS